VHQIEGTDGPGSLSGKRVLVIGASAGIGRALAIRAVREGAQVLMAARRGAELAKAADEAGGGHPVTADVRAPADCAQLAAAARQTLGQIDILAFTVGAATLALMADADADDLRRAFETNVIGFHQPMRACLPLLAPGAVVLVLSSESIDQPRSALGAYAASKQALERTVTAWRTEHPAIRFCRVRVGQTFPTEFGSAFDGATLTRALTDWAARGLAQEHFMTPEEVAGVLIGILRTATDHPGVCLDELMVRSASALTTTYDGAIAPGQTGP
jgi:NAD(P)-dependent dehydrogenase (short-subunit alcohol dehydrogenase family)